MYRKIDTILAFRVNVLYDPEVGEKRGSLAREHGSYQKIAATLRHRIESGQITAGHYLPTERELQEDFHASRSTVRRALAAVVVSGWGQNVPSKGVVAKKPQALPRSKNVALIDSGSYVLKLLFVRISELLREHGYHLVHLGSQDTAIEESLTYAVEHRFAGAFVWPFHGYPDARMIEHLCKEIPVVTLDHRMRGCVTDLVTFDYLDAARQATARLVRIGRTRIAVSGMLDMLETTHDRFSGYLKALFDAGLSPSPRDFVFSSTSGYSASEAHLLKKRLQDPDRPDAVFVMQDEFLPAVVETVLQCGLSVPDDVAVSCIGDDIVVEVDGIGLTSVANGWEQMAVLAVDLLLKRIQGVAGVPKTEIAPHQLIVRGLCGAPEEEWTRGAEEFGDFPGELPFPKTRYQFRSSLPAALAAVSSSSMSHRRSM